jgi:hypothetical protein
MQLNIAAIYRRTDIFFTAHASSAKQILLDPYHVSNGSKKSMLTMSFYHGARKEFI